MSNKRSTNWDIEYTICSRPVNELSHYDENEQDYFSTERRALVRELRKSMRCEVGVDGRELHVYYEGDEVSCGSIRLTENDDSQTVYEVRSRNIQNGNRSYTKAVVTKKTKRLDTAVRWAKQFCTRIHTGELRYLYRKEFDHSFDKLKATYETKYSKAAQAVGYRPKYNYELWGDTFDPPQLYRPLKDYVSRGETFVDYNQEIADFVGVIDEIRDMRDKTDKLNVAFVRVKDTPDGQMVETVPMPSMRNLWKLSKTNTGGLEQHVGDIPPKLLTNLSVLTTIDDDEYVLGVGCRTSADNLFYVEV